MLLYWREHNMTSDTRGLQFPQNRYKADCNCHLGHVPSFLVCFPDLCSPSLQTYELKTCQREVVARLMSDLDSCWEWPMFGFKVILNNLHSYLLWSIIFAISPPLILFLVWNCAEHHVNMYWWISPCGTLGMQSPLLKLTIFEWLFSCL